MDLEDRALGEVAVSQEETRVRRDLEERALGQVARDQNQVTRALKVEVAAEKEAREMKIHKVQAHQRVEGQISKLKK